MKKKQKLIVILAVVVIAAVVLAVVFSSHKNDVPETVNAPEAEVVAAPEKGNEPDTEAPAAGEAVGSAEGATEFPDELASEENPVLFSVGERDYTLAEVNDTLLDMYANSYVTSMADYDTAIEYLVQMEMIGRKITELGLNQYTPEEEEAFAADAQAEWDTCIQTYVDYFLTEDTEEARKQVLEDAENYYAAYGLTKETLIEQAKWNDQLEKLQRQSVTVTDDEVNALFDMYVDQYRAMFEGNVPMYEYYKYYNGTEMIYTPDGYRGITHILLTVDDTLLEAYNTANAAFEEQQAAEEPAEGVVPVTEEDVIAAYNAVLASRQADIDDIFARLGQGESFDALIAQYGTDPGMQDPETLAEGYAVHKDSIIYDPVFTSAAFSEKMRQVGDVSDPVVGMYGIHILKYHRDVPGGAVEMTAEIRDTLESSLVSEKFAAKLAEWADSVVVYNQEAIDAAKAEAIAELSAEEQPEEAPAAEDADTSVEGAAE